MNRCIHRMFLAAFALAALVCSPAVRAANCVGTAYGDMSLNNNMSATAAIWTNETMTTRSAWPVPYAEEQNLYAGVIEKPSTSGSCSFGNIKFYGLTFAFSGARWFDEKSNTWVCDGGLNFADGASIGYGKRASDSQMVYFVNSQNWTGPESGRARFSIGYDRYVTYYQAAAIFYKVNQLTIQKNLDVFFTWTNSLASVALTVNAPARLFLEKSWLNTAESKSYEGAPALQAKSVKFSGDGILYYAGGVSPEKSASGQEFNLEPVVNATTLSADLTLDNGADMQGSGAVWELENLKVTGTGASVLSGSWTFVPSTVGVSIDSGASLEMNGTFAEPDGTSVGLSLTGAGQFIVDAATYALTGPITLADTLSVRLKSAATVFSGSFAGSAPIEVTGEASGITCLSADSFLDYTGTITVSSGRVRFDRKPERATVVTSGTGVVYYDASDSTVCYDCTDRNNRKYTDADGNVTSWIPGATMRITGWNGNSFTVDSASMYALVYDAHNYGNGWVERGAFTVGAGGITFKQWGDLVFGSNVANTRQLIISDSQEWTDATDGTSGYSFIDIGSSSYNDYCQSVLGVGPRVKKLKISGMLQASFTAPNDLRNVDVEVVSPAVLFLTDSWTVNGFDMANNVALQAKSLTLRGDGDGMFPVGRAMPYCVGNSRCTARRCLAVINAARVASSLVLADGADLAATESKATYDLPTLTVKGAGESVLSGEFDMNRGVFAVNLAEGGSLAFAGRINEVNAGTVLNATGSGTVTVATNDFALTGPVSIGSGVRFRVRDCTYALPAGSALGGDLELAAGGELVLSEPGLIPAGATVAYDGGTLVTTQANAPTSFTADLSKCNIHRRQALIRYTDGAPASLPDVTVPEGWCVQLVGDTLFARRDSGLMLILR